MSRVVRVLVACAVAVLLAGCTMLPETGPVRRTAAEPPGERPAGGTFNAPGPGQGDAPIQIVNGFLTAMTSNPAGTGTARAFLSKRAREQWNPASGTVVYEATSVIPGPGSTVDARLADPRRLDARGGWLGAAGAAYARLALRMVKEGGEWRIANPPDALLIPDYFLQQEYKPYELYFFDSSQRVLVPDRVYLPRGEQTPSLLVRALLDGPGTILAPVTRTAFPPQTQLDLSVPVSPDGVAEVPLSPQMLRLPPATLTRAAAQLAWTLRQVPGLTRIRLTVDDNPLPLPDGRRDFSVEVGDRYAPSVRTADPDLFALRAGRLVRLGAGGVAAVTGPFGRPGFALRSVTASLDGTRAAAVSRTGQDVYVGPVDGGRSGALARPPARVYRGTDVLAPAFDLFGGPWLVDRTPSGARVLHVEAGGAREVDVPGISGRRVTAFVVSRDGTRLVAILDGGPRADSLVVAEVLRSGDGGLARAGRARPITSVPSDFRELVDVVWRSPGDLAVLARPAATTSDVALVSLDGSPGDPGATIPDSWRGAARALVGAPDLGQPLYLVTATGTLRRLDSSGRWRPVADSMRLTSVGYVG